MRKSRKKHSIVRNVILAILAVLIITIGIYLCFGGFTTGKSADTEEFSKYARQVSEITVPEDARIIALGEATHGNAEFQQLKLDVFRIMVEKYGVRSFALEADCGCCESANRYIHGGEGTAEQAAAGLGFQIYNTDEMAQLLAWMREYNEKAAKGEELIFYGFDMQSYDVTYDYFIETAKKLGADTAELEKIWNEEVSDNKYTSQQKADIINKVKAELPDNKNLATVQAVHFADILLQNIELSETVDDTQAGLALRDNLMSENVMWILEQEKARGNSRIFISGHNGHVNQSGAYDEDNKFMGHYLADEIGEASYFVIGTDFYKTKNNMPKGTKNALRSLYIPMTLWQKRQKCGYDISWLDFSEIPEKTTLYSECTGYCYMGNLGENQITLLNRVIMHAFPYSYRIWGSPASMYDGMILVTEAHPTQIRFSL